MTDTSQKSPKYPSVDVDLIGEDGNAFMIIGRVTRELRRHGVPNDKVDAFRRQALDSESYNDLLNLVSRTVNVN